MATRHLLLDFVFAALNRGKSVDCLLGAGEVRGERTIRWVTLRKDGGQVLASLYEVLDQRTPWFLDVYEFTSVAEESDEPLETHRFDEATSAVEFARARWGADPSRYVNQGMLSEECEDVLGKTTGAASS